MVLNFTGFEGGVQTAGNGGWDVQPFGGTGASLSTTTVRTGTYALRVNKSGANQAYLRVYAGWNADGTINGSVSNATSYVQFWFRYATKPASNSEIIFLQNTTTDANAALSLTSAGKLQIFDWNIATPTSLATGSATLSADTWYNIRVKTVAGSSGTYDVYIDGALDITGSRSWTDTSPNSDIYLGARIDTNSQDYDCFFDDVIIDNASFPDQTSSVKVIKPNANGSTMSWSSGTGSSDYQEVDEIPPNDGTTAYVMSPNTGNPNVGLFDLQSCSDVGITGTILSFKGQIITRENTASTSATLIRVRSNVTNSDSSTRNGSTAITGQTLLLNTDPDTSSTWTTSGINAVEVGAVENNAVSTRCSNVMGYVLYVPSTTIEYILTAATGSFALTYQTTVVSRVITMIASAGAFVLTGFSAMLSSSAIWTTITKSITSWSNGSKNSTSFNNQSKNSTSWTNRNKS